MRGRTTDSGPVGDRHRAAPLGSYGGISGLRKALADPSQLLPVLAALGISHEVIASAFDTPESLETARPNPSR